MNRFRRLLVRWDKKSENAPFIPAFRLWLDRVSSRQDIRIGFKYNQATFAEMR